MNANNSNPHIDQLMQRALTAHQQNQWQQAAQLYQLVLSQQPQHVAALTGLGDALESMGQSAQALQCFDTALQVQGPSAELYNGRGISLCSLNRLGEAISSYEMALQLRSDMPGVWFNRGLVLHRMQRYNEAEQSLSNAIRLQPDYVDARYCRVMTLFAASRYAEALQGIDLILQHLPDFARGWNLRGQLLSAMDNSQEALASFDRCLQLQQNYAEAWLGKAAIQNSLQLFQEASASYARAFALNPDLGFALGLSIHSKTRCCDWNDLPAQIETLVSHINNQRVVTQPFAVLPLLDDPHVHHQAARLWLNQLNQAAPAIGTFSRHEKIRLGYFSADFHNHATAHLMAELFELHDRNRYELIAFSFGPVADDPMRNRLKKAFDQFIDVRHVPDHDVVRLSRQMEIDIAIDLKGFTQDCRENLFVQRVAPVQVNYLGTPGTMGSTQWDYIIADKTVIPEDCQQYYAEQVVYLPHCYQVNDRKREVADRIFTRAELRLPDKGFIFCSFNNSYKILPETFSSWVRILQQVPGSVLWLLYDGEAAASNLRAEAQRRGIDDSRLIFAERIPSALYLARFRMADLFLDTFPCSAHTTASDALRSGVPLLTRMGRSFASRVAGSILHTLELPELITTTVEAFECRAVQLASAPVQLAEIKNKVAEAVRNSPLFDTAKFARHIEAAYSAMYERYQSGLPPISFAVQTVRDEAVAERP